MDQMRPRGPKPHHGVKIWGKNTLANGHHASGMIGNELKIYWTSNEQKQMNQQNMKGSICLLAIS